MAQPSRPVQCQSNSAGVNAVIVYGDETYPMFSNPTAGVVGAAAPRWSLGALWALMAAAGALILVLLVLKIFPSI